MFSTNQLLPVTCFRSLWKCSDSNKDFDQSDDAVNQWIHHLIVILSRKLTKKTNKKKNQHDKHSSLQFNVKHDMEKLLDKNVKYLDHNRATFFHFVQLWQLTKCFWVLLSLLSLCCGWASNQVSWFISNEFICGLLFHFWFWVAVVFNSNFPSKINSRLNWFLTINLFCPKCPNFLKLKVFSLSN